MICCGKCIGDRGLSRTAIHDRSKETGKCPTCGAENVPLIDTSELSDEFQFLVSAYRPDATGKALVDWLREDWSLFPPGRLDRAHANELLAELLDDGEQVRAKYQPVAVEGPHHLDRWKLLREELMHKNRYFPETELDKERLADLLDYLKMDDAEIPRGWFRGRIEREGQPYPPERMGAPPAHVASHGRANPAGIPYLYLASTPDTAVSEVRPQPGEVVCVAEFALRGGVNLVDLRDPKQRVSAFEAADESTLPLLRLDLQFLERLGEELEVPVLPTEAAIAYIPSQYLCEFIKQRGYEGVIYGSSVSDGINLALFYPDLATIGAISEYRVNEVRFGISRIVV